MAEHGANALAKIAEPFIKEIEDVDTALLSLQGEYMNRCKAKREEKKTIYAEAKEKGIAIRPLKGIVKGRRLQRKIDAIAADFDIDEAAAYKEIAEGLGPLGQAAATRAGYATGSDDDNKDLRPGFMQAKDAEQPAGTIDQGDLSKVGRGPVDKQDKKKQHPVDALAH